MKKQFTLIELLIVIAIFAVLAGMLFPAISKIKDVADNITCANLMKQRFNYYQLYTNDYGYLPQHTSRLAADALRGNHGMVVNYKMPMDIMDCSVRLKYANSVPNGELGLHKNTSSASGFAYGPWLNTRLSLVQKPEDMQNFKDSSYSLRDTQVTRPSMRIFIGHVMADRGSELLGQSREYLLEDSSWLWPWHENFSMAPILNLDGHYTAVPMPIGRIFIGKRAGVCSPLMNQYFYSLDDSCPYTVAFGRTCWVMGKYGTQYPRLLSE